MSVYTSTIELFHSTGFKLLLQVFNVTSGTIEECTEFLQEGNVVAVAPGGVREAFFSDSNYHLIWGNRVGFAKCAIEAKVVSVLSYHSNSSSQSNIQEIV